MKNTINLLLALLIATALNAQSITVYGDPIIMTIGGQINPKTEHNPVLSIGVRASAVDELKNMVVITYEYTNLSSKYSGYYIGYGRSYKLNESFSSRDRGITMSAYIDIGLITRELIPVDELDTRNDPVSITGAINGITSFRLTNRLSLELHYAYRLRSDIEGKLFGGNGDIGINYKF